MPETTAQTVPTAEQIDEAVQCYTLGASLNEVARRLGMSGQRFSQILLERGLDRTAGLNPESLDDAIRRYENGAGLHEAARAGVPWRRLLAVLRERRLFRQPPRSAQPTSEATATETPAPRARRSQVLTFGIEIECYLPMGTVACGAYHRGLQIPGLPEGWNARLDGSLRASDGFQAVEVVSPILSGAAGIQQIKTVCEWLKNNGAKVNEHCGFHVHVGWNGTVQQLQNLVRLTIKHEQGIFAATGTKRREEGSFCRSIRNNIHYRSIAQGMTVRPDNLGRYFLLNLSNLGRGGKKTVEFRPFAGTTNVVKIMAYVSLCLGLVQKAKAETTPPMTSGDMVQINANGSAAARQLIDELGWGNCRNYGLIGEETPMASMVFELGRLAQKYDGNDNQQPE